MKKWRLSKQEKSIEKALVTGDYVDVAQSEFRVIAEAINRKKKDAVLNIRVNHEDLNGIKRKAKRLGVKYQSLISELLHRFAA